MLAKAMNDTKSSDPLKVARALEGMKYQSDTGEVWMRADDHQLMQPIYIATFTKAGGKDVKIDAEGTGFGWKTDIRIEPAANKRRAPIGARRFERASARCDYI